MQRKLVVIACSLLALLITCAGCAGVKSAINTTRVIVSWIGKTPADVTARWGQPALDLSGSELANNMQYCPMKETKTGPLTITAPDEDVVRVLVYKPAPGTTLVSADGKKKCTTSTKSDNDTMVCFGVYASGKIQTYRMTEASMNMKGSSR